MSEEQGQNQSRVGDPALDEAIRTFEEIAGPAFQRADAAAKKYQKRFRAAELTVIFGSVVAVALGFAAGLANQTGMSLDGLTGKDLFSFSELLLTGALGSLAFISRGLKLQRRWLRRRWAAETLRGEKFLFVGGFGDYAEAAEPDRTLRRKLIHVERMVRNKEGGDE